MTHLETLLRKHAPGVDITFIAPLLVGLEAICLPQVSVKKNADGSLALDRNGDAVFFPTDSAVVPFYLNGDKSCVHEFRGISLDTLSRVADGEEPAELISSWKSFLLEASCMKRPAA